MPKFFTSRVNPLDGQFHLLWKDSVKDIEGRIEATFAKTLGITEPSIFMEKIKIGAMERVVC